MRLSADVKADMLYTFAVANLQGFTRDEVCDEYQWTFNLFTAAKKRLRRRLKEDSINLVCDPWGQHVWVYRLVGTADAAVPWAQTSIGHIESRIDTWVCVTQSVLHDCDPSSGNRRMLLMHKHLSRLLEDLEEVTA